MELNKSSHFVVKCSLSDKSSKKIPSLALIDSGASAYGFVDVDFARSHQFEMIPLRRPRTLKVFDGTESISGAISFMVSSSLCINGHTEKILLYVTKLAHFNIVLGLPWLQHHNPEINWEKEELKFNDPRCSNHYIAPCVKVTALSSDEIDKIRKHGFSVKHSPPIIDTEVCSLEKFQGLVGDNNVIMSVSIKDIEEALKEKPRIDPAEKLPKIYHSFLPVFSRDEADKLPPHRPSDHKIHLKPGSEPPWGPLYGMSREELDVLKKYIRENLEKGFIRPSSSPAASPVLFVKKPGGGLRFCVDYRALNELTIKNRYPIPRINETLSLLGKAKYFTKLDVISAFNRMRIAEGDEYLTAFRTRFGLYEYLVMPFGLANAPSSFQNYINDTLKGYLDEFCTAYIDDILIFSGTLQEHEIHVKKVLSRLQEAGLQIDINKCEFHSTSVKFLGLIITTKGIEMDPTKLEAIEKWEQPKNTKDIFRFVGFINFYRRFINKFGSIVMPLTDLMKKDANFVWGSDQQNAFAQIKSKFKENVVIQHFDWDKPTRLETDASDRGTGGVLLQPDMSGNWRPVAFFSKKMSPAEANYEIYDKELLAIVQAFEEWRPELEGSSETIDVVTDHKALEYFMKSRLLSRRQARWSEFLSRFNFKICYRPGKENECADTLSRPSGTPDPSLKKFLEQRLLKPHNLSPGMEDVQLLMNEVQPADYVDPPVKESGTQEEQPSFIDRIRRAIPHDDQIKAIMSALQSHGTVRVSNFTLSECNMEDELLYYRGLLVVPQCDYDKTLTTELIASHHELPASGHQGAAATYATLVRTFFWHGMHTHVKRFVRNCHTCSRIKPSRDGLQGLLRPLPVAKERWRHVAMDFVVDLPPSKDWNGQEYRSMFVVVDRMTKQVHIIPCQDLSSKNTAYMFYKECFRLHGLPDSIVSDRGTQFTSEFWKWICKLLQIDHRLSTAYHPQTDGQTERMNARIEQYLRAYVNYVQNDWVRYLPSAEFTLNNHDSQVTGVSPFLAIYGSHPRSGCELSPPLSGPPVPASIRFERKDAEDLVRNAKIIEKYIVENIQLKSAEHEHQANKNRIASRNYKPSKKLDFKKGGPYKITECIGKYAFKLKLPESAKIHPVFHVSLLSPTASDPLPGQIVGPQPVLEAGYDGDEFEVEKVIGSHWKDNKFYYVVRFKGEGPEEDLSIPLSDSEGFKELIKDFHDMNPSEPKPSDKPFKVSSNVRNNRRPKKREF
ncbi:Transposon Ty3-I Gag-Pol polyprotein [Podosphaera aphanis]|nr:Transposon Ty3-I Gag-Pol polyprotein [Podosphaera aphanis]